MSESEFKTVVIDNGSGMMKVGFAGDDAPASVFPSVVGRREKKTAAGTEQEVSVGADVYENMMEFTINRPIERSVVSNWDDAEILWKNAFENVLKVDPKDCLVLLTDSPTNEVENREKMVETFFEKFDMAGIYIANQAALSMYSAGRMTGLVLDCGYGTTFAAPVYEGYAIKDAILTAKLGGKDLTAFLIRLLAERGYSCRSTPTTLKEIKSYKETKCHVSLNFDDDMKASGSLKDKGTFNLPDDQVITVDKEAIQCPEAIFNPKLIDLDSPGIPKMVYDSFGKCEVDVRAALASNSIILSGGSTLFSGFEERLRKEMETLIGGNICIHAHKDRINYPWIGGSVLASLSDLKDKWITREHYKETGSAIVRQKCV